MEALASIPARGPPARKSEAQPARQTVRALTASNADFGIIAFLLYWQDGPGSWQLLEEKCSGRANDDFENRWETKAEVMVGNLQRLFRRGNALVKNREAAKLTETAPLTRGECAHGLGIGWRRVYVPPCPKRGMRIGKTTISRLSRDGGKTEALAKSYGRTNGYG
jgi:hypothetical protein